MNLTTTTGLDLCIGSGFYSFRLSIHGQGFLIRVPLLGKAWSYPGGHGGRMGWAAMRQEDRLGLAD